MQSESEKQQSWKIRVQAKSKSFNFKLKATTTTTLPTWKFHRLSILLKLHNFLLQVKSNSQHSFFTRQQQLRRPTLKSGLLSAFHKFRARLRVKNRNPEIKSPINPLFAYYRDSFINSLVIWVVSFVFWNGRKMVTGKVTTTVLAFSVIATLVCLVGLDTSLNCYIAEFVLKVCNYLHVASSKTLYELLYSETSPASLQP
ncbi:hypothetical protein QYF36_008281 [Acer negundo]|nr:hypothetical protein QYF36_008281 [Acer negundo]